MLVRLLSTMPVQCSLVSSVIRLSTSMMQLICSQSNAEHCEGCSAEQEALGGQCLAGNTKLTHVDTCQLLQVTECERTGAPRLGG